VATSTSNPVALVTGAGSGIGEKTAIKLADAGFHVICTGRRVEKLQHVVEEIGEGAIAVQLDVTDSNSVENLLDGLPSKWRNIEVLVNCAGHDVGGRSRFDAGKLENYIDIITTNLIGLMRITHAVVAGMVEQSSGHIVNIGSLFGVRSVPGESAYCASKYGVHGFTETLRMDFADTPIRVTEILPGMVRTDFAATRFSDKGKADEFYDEFGDWLTPADIANAVVYAIQQPPNVVVAQMTIVTKNQV